MRRLSPGRLAFHLVLSLGVLISLLPFYWLVVMATGTTEDIYAYPPNLVPGPHLLDNISTVRSLVDLPMAFLNTVIVAVLTSGLTLFFASLAGFTFARFRFPGRNVLFVVLLLTMALPTQLGTIPSFVIMSELRWVGTLQALIVPGVAGAFGIFWMRQFALGAVPQDLVDAGRVDGCSFWQLYLNALPLLRPALAFLGIFTFIGAWNDYFWPLIVLVNPNVMTLQVALAQLNGVYKTDYAAVMAGTLLSTIPLVVIFILGARHIIGNLAAGALKG